MLRQTPPLETIEAFLGAAHAESFRQAASALALSPSALSRRIQLLESFLGTSMFDRSGPRPRLSEAGMRYRDEIGPALEMIRRATRELRASETRVRLSASHSIAVGWLMPRLHQLRDLGVELDLSIAQGVETLRTGQADIAICGGADAPSGFTSEILLDLEAYVVSAETLANGRPPPQRVNDLAEHDLLSTAGSPTLWPRWLELTGAGSASPGRSRTFPTLHAMYEAAASGLGLALAIPLAAERFLDEARLRPRLPVRALIGQQYRLVLSEPRQSTRLPVTAFTAWLRGEVAASQARFRGLGPQTP